MQQEPETSIRVSRPEGDFTVSITPTPDEKHVLSIYGRGWLVETRIVYGGWWEAAKEAMVVIAEQCQKV